MTSLMASNLIERLELHQVTLQNPKVKSKLSSKKWKQDIIISCSQQAQGQLLLSYASVVMVQQLDH
jgi:hypothetical protein